MEEISRALSELNEVSAFPSSLPTDVTDTGELKTARGAEIEDEEEAVADAKTATGRTKAQTDLQMSDDAEFNSAMAHMV